MTKKFFGAYLQCVAAAFSRYTLSVALALLLLHSNGRADVLARYDISLECGADDLDPSIVRPNVTATAIKRVGLSPNTDLCDVAELQGNPNFAFVSTDWPIDAFGVECMEITITPAPGYALRFQNVKYAFGGFPRMTYRIATSLDNFASSIFGPFTAPVPPPPTEFTGYIRETIGDSLAALPPVIGPITFRWYAYVNSDTPPYANGLWAGFFDSNTPKPIIFNGTVERFDLRITSFARAGNDAQLSFATTLGKNYRVEFRPALDAGSWQTLANSIPGTGAIVVFTDSGALIAPRRYYRVVLL